MENYTALKIIGAIVMILAAIYGAIHVNKLTYFNATWPIRKAGFIIAAIVILYYLLTGESIKIKW
ncbi:MAG: hypothetical protein LBV44_01430 [Methylobacillus sp.]|jgi:uncharacterized membrane protein|nr:hypothetical protein [Methylobacillus sp.]